MLTDKPILPPPYIRYPQIDRGSMEWRMGIGEHYVNRWNDFRRSLTQEELREYYRLFPEPAVWRGAMTGERSLGEYWSGGVCLERWREDNRPKYSREQLVCGAAALTRENAVFFWGHRPSKNGIVTSSCLSQWYMAPFFVCDTQYCCMEQFMMASKARMFHDEETLAQILKSHDPQEIKKLGRKVRNFSSEAWDAGKYLIILNGNFRKFTQNPALRDYLLSTGEKTLVEASPYDTIWGVGLSAEDPCVGNPRLWRGENLLGFALMEVRDEIAKAYANVHLCAEQPEIF